MSQNLIYLTLTDEQLTAADQALAALEGTFAGLIALDGEQRKGLNRMGAKSEAFCRQTFGVLAQNPQIVPPSIGLADAQTDLATLDRLRPRLLRLQKLVGRAEDSDTAFGSDVMSLSLEGYALLKVAGRNHGLEALRKELSGRFNRTRAPEPAPAAAYPATSATRDPESRFRAAFRGCDAASRASRATIRATVGEKSATGGALLARPCLDFGQCQGFLRRRWRFRNRGWRACRHRWRFATFDQCRSGFQEALYAPSQAFCAARVV